ncbi:hypothetical protein [Aliidiomarina haloalkalitolerans]|uniref:DUF3862 domain-containing protein n=1 Tax=Aliidiomarina haloalkalitolerans TaxID=859059 RepID=A0A432VQW9_9GAMM|nr:hypothetical protein [Aliidiomarina haloalkalitolerans]RUO18645.1 hypothetical protein CWE06_10400 [Aliidiomarina haloalkalitolerans]
MLNRKLQGKSVLATLAVAAGVFLLTACTDPKVTRTNYNLIAVGMHYSEVQAILGEPTWCDNMQRPNECRWGNDNKHIHVTFAARRVVNTESKGLN